MPRRLKNLVIDRVDLVDKGANQEAKIVLVKRHRDDKPASRRNDGQSEHSNEFQGDDRNPEGGAQAASSLEWEAEYPDTEDGKLLKATLDSGTRNALPDSAFAAVWSDKDGKKQRKLPYKHKDGSVDLPHLRNALAVLGGAHGTGLQIPDDVKAKAKTKLQAAAKTHGVGEQNKRFKMSKNSMFKRLLTFLAKEAEAEAGVDGQQDDDEAQEALKEARLPDEHQNYLKDLHAHLGKMIEATKGADGSHAHLPADHPIHKIKDVHKAVGEMLAAYGKEPGEPGEQAFEGVPNEGGPEPYGREPKSRNAATKRLEKSLADVRVDLKKAQDELKAERDVRAKAETSASLRKFRGVSVDVEKDADVFLRLAQADPDAHKRIMEILGAADAAVSTSKAFDEFGTSRTGATSAWARIEAEADKVVAKGAKGMTKQKAIDLVMKQQPALVREYEAEQRGNVQ